MGSFITGSFAFSLQHRHDIRVGIASGMYLKPLILDRAKRLELLAVLYPCYWRWSTKLMLERILAHLDQYLAADALGRSEIIEKALQSMMREMVAYQVVGFRKEQRLELMSRTHAKRFNAKKNDAFRYHPFQSPAGRRTIALEVPMLLGDLRTGNLLRACEALSQAWQTDPSYSESSRIVLAHGIKLWAGRGRKYGRTRLPALAHNFQIVFCIAFFFGRDVGRGKEREGRKRRCGQQWGGDEGKGGGREPRGDTEGRRRGGRVLIASNKREVL